MTAVDQLLYGRYALQKIVDTGRPPSIYPPVCLQVSGDVLDALLSAQQATRTTIAGGTHPVLCIGHRDFPLECIEESRTTELIMEKNDQLTSAGLMSRHYKTRPSLLTYIPRSERREDALRTENDAREGTILQSSTVTDDTEAASADHDDELPALSSLVTETRRKRQRTRSIVAEHAAASTGSVPEVTISLSSPPDQMIDPDRYHGLKRRLDSRIRRRSSATDNDSTSADSDSAERGRALVKTRRPPARTASGTRFSEIPKRQKSKSSVQPVLPVPFSAMASDSYLFDGAARAVALASVSARKSRLATGVGTSVTQLGSPVSSAPSTPKIVAKGRSSNPRDRIWYSSSEEEDAHLDSTRTGSRQLPQHATEGLKTMIQWPSFQGLSSGHSGKQVSDDIHEESPQKRENRPIAHIPTPESSTIGSQMDFVTTATKFASELAEYEDARQKLMTIRDAFRDAAKDQLRNSTIASSMAFLEQTALERASLRAKQQYRALINRKEALQSWINRRQT